MKFVYWTVWKTEYAGETANPPRKERATQTTIRIRFFVVRDIGEGEVNEVGIEGLQPLYSLVYTKEASGARANNSLLAIPRGDSAPLSRFSDESDGAGAQLDMVMSKDQIVRLSKFAIGMRRQRKRDVVG